MPVARAIGVAYEEHARPAWARGAQERLFSDIYDDIPHTQATRHAPT